MLFQALESFHFDFISKQEIVIVLLLSKTLVYFQHYVLKQKFPGRINGYRCYIQKLHQALLRFGPMRFQQHRFFSLKYKNYSWFSH